MMDSGTTEGESRKRGRSQWDEELDRGKVGLLASFDRELASEGVGEDQDL